MENVVKETPESPEMRHARIIKQIMYDNIRPCNPNDWAEREDRRMLGKYGRKWRRFAQF